MDLISNIVLLLISNSISILFTWLLWQMIIIPLKALRLYTVCYRLFTVLPVFWLVPFHYLYCCFIYFKKDTVWTGLPWHGDAFENILHILCVVWLLGVLISAACVILGIYQLKRLPLSDSPGMVSQAGQIARQMDKKAWLLDDFGNIQLYPGLDFVSPVRVYQTMIPVPMTPIGFTRKILLPFHSYTDKELQMVVAHELSHIRRHDLALRELLIFIKIVFWFHPLAWRIFRDFEYWSEIACDIDVCSGKNIYVNLKEYLYLLVENSRNIRRFGRQNFYERSCFMSGLGNGVKGLRDRIDKVHRHRRYKHLPLITVLTCLLFLLLGTGLSVAALLSFGDSGFFVWKNGAKTYYKYFDMHHIYKDKKGLLLAELDLYIPFETVKNADRTFLLKKLYR